MNQIPLRVALAAVLLSANASAITLPESAADREDHFAYEVELGAEYSDNRARLDPDADAGTTLLPRTRFSLSHHGSRLQTTAIGQAEYYRRLGSNLGNDLLLQLIAVADWAISPQRLYWTLQDHADVDRIDVAAPSSPSNRQQINTLITGPTLLIRPQEVWNGELTSRYSSTYAEKVAEFDSDRLSAGLRATYAPRASRALSLGAEASDVRYREAGAEINDYQRLDTTIRLQNYLRRLSWEVTAGHSSIDFDNGERLSGPLLRLWARWMFGQDHHLVARLGREYSDVADDLMGTIAQYTTLRPDRGNPQVGPELFRQRTAELQWTSSGRRGEWSITPYYRDFHYPVGSSALSHTARGADFRGSYRINSTITLNADVGIEEDTFESRKGRDYRASLSLDRRISSRWSLRAGVVRYQRSGSGLETNNYSENIVSLALVLRSGR